MSKLTEYFDKQKEKAVDVLMDFLKDIDIEEKESNIEEKETIKDIEQEEEQIKTEEENSKVLEQIQDSIKNYQKIAGTNPSSTSKIYKGQNLVGTPQSMGAFGPLSQMKQPSSPLFASQDLFQSSKLKDISTTIANLQKLLKGGVNV